MAIRVSWNGIQVRAVSKQIDDGYSVGWARQRSSRCKLKDLLCET